MTLRLQLLQLDLLNLLPSLPFPSPFHILGLNITLSLSSPWLPFILILFILFIILFIILYLVLITFHHHHLAAFSQVDDFGCSTIDCVFGLFLIFYILLYFVYYDFISSMFLW